MVRNFKATDEGKRVVTADGNEVGTIRGAAGSTAHVAPVRGLTRSVRRRLGWGTNTDTYELPTTAVATIGEDVVTLKRTL
ncbi:hypothetical protein ACFQRB_20515 [Halobaculum litoreum]|uniref:PRC-barrel domain-containing protein n=1 Tax=Halobaculum litoreum TaxID=3031998 RepID=A0ABD5XSQ8_9EURY